MKKKLRSMLSLLLTLVLLAGIVPTAALAAGTGFADVSPSAWYAAPVMWAVEKGVTGGIGNGLFGPENPCTRAQVVTFLWAAEGKPEPSSYFNPFTDVANNAWYAKPVLWAVEQGITGGTSPTTFSPDNECTRAQIVTFLYAAADKPNVFGKSEFTDVTNADWFAKPVLWAKQNDITGGTSPTTFGPNNVCTRGQVVTFLYKAYKGSAGPAPTTAPTPVITPIVTPVPTPTITPVPVITPAPVLNAEQIYAQCASAVFYIEIYDQYGQMLGSGSGVFLTADGLAITNHHVIDGAHSAKILTTDGKVYDVQGYYDAKEAIDMALIQIDGSGFDYLDICTDNVVGGQSIFAIGSPQGLDNTISTGIVSNPNRILSGIRHIQITAPISPGSSGGALISNKGQLIGITTAYFEGGQNLNLAMPIEFMQQLSQDKLHSLPIGSSTPEYTGAGMDLESAAAVELGNSMALGIFCDRGNYAGNLSLYYEIHDESIVSAQWDNWYGDDTNLFITGLNPGTTTISLFLTTDDNVLLAESAITVTVTAPASNYGASITCADSITMEIGTTEHLEITANEGSYPYPQEVSVYYEFSIENMAIAGWGEWNGDRIDLEITAGVTGTTILTVYLLGLDDEILAYKDVTLTITYPKKDYGTSLQVDPTSLSLVTGGKGILHIAADAGSYPAPEDLSVYYEIAEESVVLAEWSETDFDLFVYGQSTGSTTITFYLLTEEDQILASETVDVTVTASKPIQKTEAFQALKRWLLANNNTTVNGMPAYRSSEYVEGSYIDYTLIYDSSNSCFDLMTRISDDEAAASTILSLDLNYTSSIASIYMYWYESSATVPVFKGFAEIEQSAFCESMNISFYETSGDSSNLSDAKYLMTYMSLAALDYVNNIFRENAPAYSIADLGFTNVYN